MERYEILRHLGSGSFGNVVVALEKCSKRNVAIKFIGKVGKQEKEIESLKKEWETHKNLRHPNVILMMDSFETSDSIVLVTELAHGDLYKVVPQYSRWQPGAVQKIACDLVSALHFLHSKRILHRDLKPQNVLIGFDGKSKLCDFGFAKEIGMNSFMLTSMKGTPLYMAPEIILEQPYDQSADLWSLGCILYELLVGQPPFHTNSLFVLRKMMQEADIVWHGYIHGDALPFLQGLLEKDPKKRLAWPHLLYQPYVLGKLVIDRSVAEFALTKALSPSQELVKETERQLLQKELEQCSRVYRKAMKKYAQAQKKLKRWNSEMVIGRGKPLPLDCAKPVQLTKPPALNNPAEPPQQDLQIMLQNLKLQQTATPTASNVQSAETMTAGNKGNTASSTPDATTSSSDCETESDEETDEDGRKTVLGENSRKINGNSVEIMADNTGGSGGEAGILFTLDTSGSTEFNVDCEEWLYFLMKTMREVVEDPQSLCEKGVLTMVVGPLKSTSAKPQVLEKIAVLLSLPFTLDDERIHETAPGLFANFQALYVATKVLPLLLFACKLIVVNRVSGLSLTFDKIVEQLSEEDLDGLEKCFRLVTFLVHMEDSFVTQFCDSVCVLKLTAILQLFLRLDEVRTNLATETIAVLCHLLRIFPNNKSIVEDIFLGGYNKNSRLGCARDELWRLISHANPLIQSKSIRLFAYLFLNSERFKCEFVDKRRALVWNVLRKATISSNHELRETAKFATQALNCKPSQGSTEKSTSTTSTIRNQNIEAKTFQVPIEKNQTADFYQDCNHDRKSNEVCQDNVVQIQTNHGYPPTESSNNTLLQETSVRCANEASR